jgi:hypothetical protein
MAKKNDDIPVVIDERTGRKRNELTGMKFGRWTVLRFGGRRGWASTWVCRCECGTVKEGVLYTSLVNGGSNSCGCLHREMLSLGVGRTHGMSNTKLYRAWAQMKVRCYDETRRSWKDYGGRGIVVSERWLESFDNFFADMLAAGLADPPWGSKFDRIENNGNYEPGNVRWVDDFVSNRNKRRTKWYDWKGGLRTLVDIAVMENVSYNSFRNKIFLSGMTLEESLADCKARGLVYKEKAKGKRPAQYSDIQVLF